MLESLTFKISNIVNKFSSKKKIDEYDVKLILRDFRKTLIDADVSWSVTKHLIERMRDKLNSAELKRASHKDFFVKSVINEFLSIFEFSVIRDYDNLFNKLGLNVIFFIGLQGAGKTTSLIKLANFIKSQNNKSVLVVSCDVYRPAAVDQLSILANNLKIDCFLDFSLDESPVSILTKALNYSRVNHYNFLIIDSAGRSHVDEFMIKELIELYKLVNPDFSFLVVDSIVGQDGIKNAMFFCEKIRVSGFFLTKMDSDSKGGVLLSLSFLTKKPIFFLGFGEKVNDISYFYPDRIVSRILGFGDVSTLLDEINKKLEFGKNSDQLSNIIFSSFNLNDFKKQLEYILELGGMTNLLDKMPGGHSIDKSLLDKFDNKFFLKMIAIINSMTKSEKKFPSLINGSRKRRISLGSGTSISDIGKMLKYYDKMKKLFGKIGDEKTAANMIKKKFF